MSIVQRAKDEKMSPWNFFLYASRKDAQYNYEASIIESIEVSYGIKFNVFMGSKIKSRKLEHVWPRFIYFYFMIKLNHCTLSKIGDNFGFNHATILNGKNKVADRIQFDKVFRLEMEALERKILTQWEAG